MNRYDLMQRQMMRISAVLIAAVSLAAWWNDDSPEAVADRRKLRAWLQLGFRGLRAWTRRR